MRLSSIPLALAFAMTAGAAAAQPEAARQDFRCIVVVGMIAGRATTPEQKQQIGAAMAYYIGRLRAREPGADLGLRLMAEAQGLAPTDLQADFARCRDEMTGFATDARTVGEALKALGEQAR